MYNRYILRHFHFVVCVSSGCWHALGSAGGDDQWAPDLRDLSAGAGHLPGALHWPQLCLLWGSEVWIPAHTNIHTLRGAQTDKGSVDTTSEISLHVKFSGCFGKNGWRCGLAGQVVHFRLKQRPSSLNSSANWFSFKKFPEQKESRKPGPRCRCMVGRTRKASRFKISLKTNNEYFVIWGLLRKAAKALFLNDEFTEAQKHNYFMSVTEREVYKGCINAKNVKVSKKSFAAVLTLQSFDRFGDNH